MMIDTNGIKFVVLTLVCFLTKCDCTTEFGNRILNGKRADDYQFPYQVSVQMDNQHQCGGSIISEVKVLTAGHCVTDEYGHRLSKARFKIMAGSNYLDNPNPLNYYSVKHIAIHPKFDRLTVRYDYAIIFIKKKFNFNATNISKLPLAVHDPLPGTVCYLSGWGDVDTNDNVKRTANALQYAKITIDPASVCKEFFPNIFKEDMICAGKTNAENAGAGDSGGGLVCNSNLTGIVSFGATYYDSSLSEVYSSVFYASDWIMKTSGSCGSNKSVLKIIGLLMTWMHRSM